ncbi:MAG: DUF2336 domain-containing protein [Proteobacteria bacterium]|nr:DUF2336 domain-containing protein [Pseudomonadota bacterium]
MNPETNFDAEYLLGLARQKSSESRNRLTKVIIDLFDGDAGMLNDRQRALMFGILENIINDIELSIRHSVASRLAAMQDVPRGLIVRLANDKVRVAYPILEKSGLLRDNDLIEVIQLRTDEHMLAITRRHAVSENVSDALVKSGREPVIVSLLKNQNAQISNSTMEYLVEQARRIDSFHEPIVSRDDLNPDLAKRMYLWVSVALREHIVSSFKLEQGVVDELLEQAAWEEMSDIKRDKKNKASALADALKDGGLVNSEILISALQEGEIRLFVALFAKISKLRDFLIQRLLFEPGGEGLAIAARAIGMSAADFERLFIYSQLAKAETMDQAQLRLPELMRFYEATPQKAATEVLGRWHRGSDYLSALRELQIRLKEND